LALPVRRIPVGPGDSSANQPTPPVAPPATPAALPDYEMSLPDLEDELPSLNAASPDKTPSSSGEADESDEMDEYLKQLDDDSDEFDALFASTPPPQLPYEEDEEDEEEDTDDDDGDWDSIEVEDDASIPVIEPVRPPSSEHVIEVDDDDFESFIDQAFDDGVDLEDDDELEAPLSLPDAEVDDDDDWSDEELTASLAPVDAPLEDDDEKPEEDEEPEASSEAPLEDEELPEEEEIAKPLSKKSTKPKSKSKGKGKNRSPITKLSEGMFRALTLIPFIGRLFKPFERFARFFLPAIVVLLILAIPFGVYSFAGNAITNPPILKFPDGGSATIGKFKFDKGTQTATATVTNTGDVIADVTPVFTVWSYELGLNPTKWVAFQKLGECKGTPVSVPIDGVEEVSAKCAFESIEGITPKASGSLVY
jgi:hypothetical protein